jgi:para-nitrobenzyl esterase
MTTSAIGGANRRAFLQGSSLVIGAAATASAAPAAAQPSAASASAGLHPNTTSRIFFVAETTSGKVQGIDNAGVKAFKGIPYAGPTGGRNRYMPPKTPTPWAGVKECIGWGTVNPQTPADLRSDYAQLIMWDRHVGDGPMGENGLVLNVWTPGVDGARRAVMVMFHGGGWETGSGNFPGFDGANLARFGDVVVVTVNHRLASFGYVNLVDAGAPSEFAYAGCCGVMDMTAALEWVRDNIASFGGDPGRVMIFGQSGGGAKTSVMLSVPAAKGLFHRAAVQSGSMLRYGAKDKAAENAEKLLRQLGLGRANAADIQKKGWQEILEAQVALAGQGVSFTPVMDGRYLTHDPFDNAAPMESADVPIIVSTMLEDAALRLTNFSLDDAGCKAILDQRFGCKGAEILALYRQRYPAKPAYLIQAQAFTDSGLRRAATSQVEWKAKLGRAPAYLYLWTWPCPAYDGKFGAIHGVDVSASFHNYRDQTVGVGSKDGRLMVDRLSSAWVAFAKTGDPNAPVNPHWAPYDPARRSTMIFDLDARCEEDPRKEIRQFWESMPRV